MTIELTRAQLAAAIGVSENDLIDIKTLAVETPAILKEAQEILERSPTTFLEICETDPAKGLEFIKDLFDTGLKEAENIAYALLISQNHEGSSALLVLAKKYPNETMGYIRRAPEAIRLEMFCCPYIIGELSEHYIRDNAIMKMIKEFSEADQYKIFITPNAKYGLNHLGFNENHIPAIISKFAPNEAAPVVPDQP